LYEQLKNTTVNTGVQLDNVVLQRDRVRITFADGTLYLSPAISGKIRAAVFIGSGTFEAAPPPVLFERDNVRRLLKADEVSTDFKTAVFRFTDETAADLLKQSSSARVAVSEQAIKLDRELAPTLLKESGLNIAARELESILNQESPGVFVSQFSGGKRGRFTFVLDPQTRIPASSFGINAGEKGLIFAHDSDIFSNDVWMAFDGNEDYTRGIVPYSDAYDLVSVEKYTMKLDLLDVTHKVVGLKAKMDIVSRYNALQVIPFAIGEDLSTFEDERLKRQLHVVSATLADGTPLNCFQEPWESGFSVVLPKPVSGGEHLSLTVELKGEFMLKPDSVRRWYSIAKIDLSGTYFPRSSETWYPRHGYLRRSKFEIAMLHRGKDHVVSIGEMVKEEPAPGLNDAVLTEFRMEQPTDLATFAVGPYEIHKDKARQESGRELPIEFYSMPGDRVGIKEDFILAELNNCVRYFGKFFGAYPYSVFRAAYHPFGYGQGLATTIMMPAADGDSYRTLSFIAHETSHQWWGDEVLWRSYQDQWLSEGFAEYSGILYVNFRRGWSAEKELIEESRRSLIMPPETLQGIGKGRLADIGPLIMGHRVETRESFGAYTALTYNKGALVLRMLHFLFTDPDTGNSQAFVDLMTDFVRHYQGSTATSMQFLEVANEHLKGTPLAKKYGYKDLNWFFHQWVLQTYLPSYELTYHIESDPSGGFVLRGDMLQKGIPENEKWFMPLPLIIHFDGGGVAHTTVAALGSQTPVAMKLPKRPDKVELDPEMWVLSEKTSVQKK
jgi:Peptidase family M1 domain